MWAWQLYESLTHSLSFCSNIQKPYLPSTLEERNTQAEEGTKVNRKSSAQNIADCPVRLLTASRVQVQLCAYLHSTMWSTLPWMLRSPMTCQDRQKLQLQATCVLSGLVRASGSIEISMSSPSFSRRSRAGGIQRRRPGNSIDSQRRYRRERGSSCKWPLTSSRMWISRRSAKPVVGSVASAPQAAASAPSFAMQEPANGSLPRPLRGSRK